MDFSKLNIIGFDDLIPGNKYYIEKIKYNTDHSGTAQQYGIFNRFDGSYNNTVYAVFNKPYNFKNSVTNEELKSGMGIGMPVSYCHRYHFIFYEPQMVTYNRKQNELLGKVIENITNDTYMAEYITKQGWLGILPNCNK